MRWRIAAALLIGLLVVMVASPGAWAQEKPGRPRVEYKVVFAPVNPNVTRQIEIANGKERVIERGGPKADAEDMTRQFNALAADGWEYVGPVTAVMSPSSSTTATSGVMVLFRRARE